MFSLHIDTARTWRGGQNQVLLTVNGLRSIGHRAALVAHPDGELRQTGRRRTRTDPDCAANGNGSFRRLASRASRETSPARRDSRPRSTRRRDGVARVVARQRVGAKRAGAGARRIAPRRLSSQGQFVFAMETPAGRLLHRRIRCDPARCSWRTAFPNRVS